MPRSSWWDRWRERARVRRRFARTALASPIAAGIAVTLSSTALAGVLEGVRWLWAVLSAVTVVVVLGLVLRRCRVPTVAVVAGQLGGLVLLVTGLYSSEPVLGVLPGPYTLPELGDKLSSAIGVIEGGVPPVATSSAMMLLVAACFGIMAVATDALAVAGDGPAAAGLVLLGSFTVSTALTPEALPDWSLAAGATGFALVLMTEYRRRQARLGITQPPPHGRPDGPLMRRVRAVRAAGAGVPLAVVLTAVALVVSLGLGALATVIGTVGRFPGNGEGKSDGSDGQFGLNPFTAVRGQLDREEPRELFRVRGLPDREYLRALTLSRFVPQRGWELPERYSGVNLDKTVPSGLPQPVRNPTATVQVENIKYRDKWLPLIGQPMGVTGVLPGRWRYDVSSGTAYADGLVSEPGWTERAALPDPSVRTLQDTGPNSDVNPTYLSTGGVDQRIVALAQAITRNARTPFERAVVLNRYFLDPANGFRYDTRTRPGNTGDLLLDFLTRGKAGYCEQYASAMAVMLRAVGVPSRVAVGFTGGVQVEDYRSVGTADAHAWVEANFTGLGWLTFDPTPLRDGRNITPNYVADAPNVPQGPTPPSLLAAAPGPGSAQQPPPPSPNGSIPPPPAPGQGPQPQDQPKPSPNGPEAPHSDGTGGPNQSGQGNRPNDQAGAGPGGNQSGPGAGGNQSGAAAGPGGDQAGGGSSGGNDGTGGGKDGSDGSGGGGSGDKDGPGNPLGLRLSTALWILLWMMLGLLVLVGLLATPAGLRSLARRRRLAKAAAGGAGGADAAWRELLAEFQDRGGTPPKNSTVRRTARRLARTHRLDSEAVTGMRTVVGAVEHGWYAPRADPRLGPTLVKAVASVRAGLDRSTPLTMSGRLWPRSVRPKRTGSPR